MPFLKAPTPEQVDAAIARLGKPGANAYFFDNLKNPLWIELLSKRGFFKRPPEAQRNVEEGTISFPDWPELRFLLRMAPLASDIVGKVAVDVPDTDNARVRQILVQIGAHLPRNLSKQLGKRVVGWLDDLFLRSHFGEPVPQFISHLAEHKELTVAIDIAKRMFRVDEDDVTGRSRSAIDSWHMERYLKACLPALLARGGVRTLEFLRDLLLLATKPTSPDSVEDYSYIWRTSILEANFSAKQGRDVLIDAVRDSALELARDRNVGVDRVCGILLVGGRPLLKRIALYIASQVASPDDSIVTELLQDVSLVDRPTCHEEYAMLLQSVFPRLSAETRARIEALLTSDPLQSIPEAALTPMDADRRERISKQIQRDRLLAFGASIPESLRETLAGLRDDVGEPPARRPVVMAYGPGSPLSSEELASMSVDEIVQRAKTWVSSNDFEAPKPEGLGRAIHGIIKGRLKEFADQADKWIDQDPAYVRWVITGFVDALLNKSPIEDWRPLLRLTTWAVAQIDSDPSSANDPWADRDLTWTWTRQSTARLIDTTLQHKDIRPDFGFRQDVWALLKRLLGDPDPAAESSPDGEQEPLSVAINSTGGLATHALMRYASWVHENTPGPEPFTFEAMPEVRSALDAALSDANPAIHSVLGEWFRLIYFLDAQWVRTHIDDIFPDSDDRKAFWRASWHTFAEYSPPYDPAFELLRAKYELAVARLPDEPDDDNKRTGERGLGQHLGSYFWRGIGGEPTRDLLLRYFDACSPSAAGQAASFLGRGLATEKEIPAGTVPALMNLWEQLRARSTAWPEQKRREVARQFGQWFVSGHLPAGWRLRELEDTLNRGAGLFDIESVLEELTSLVGQHPVEVAQCLGLVLQDQQQMWHPLSWQRETTAVLEALLASPNANARTQAHEIINRLVEGGSLFARDIVRNSGS